MRKYLFLALTILVFASVVSAHRLVRLYDVSRGSVIDMIEKGYDVTCVDMRHGYVDIMLPEQDVDQAALLSYDYEVLPREWGELLPENMDDAGEYYDPEENWTFWSSLSADYPELANPPVTIGQSYQSRDIYMIRLTGPTSGYKPPIYFSSLIHAREPGGNSVLIDFAMWLTGNYDGGDTRAAYILDNSTVYFVPIANPDGYVYNMPNGGNQRKNMNFTLGDGIDLNRNWGYKWDYDDLGSSPYPNDQTYRGTSAFSEPETRVQRDFIIDLEPIAAMNYHTYGGYLLYPWGYEDILSPDSILFTGWADAMTAENNYTYGTAWQILYNVNGENNDWSYCGDSLPKIYAMTPEVDDKGFWGSQNDTTEIVRICNECRPMNILFCFASLGYVGISGDGEVGIEPLLLLNSVYPNPVLSSASFRITSSGSSNVSVMIYDTSGRIIDSFETGSIKGGTSSLVWGVPHEIPAGVYTARISDAAGNCDSRRFTVMR
ncbi:MAG: T9SS type A sorting domain-containing protein [Candidatus Aegiribacteria sp.]|nr:T9SS type A sorting domain-containing protein [Candidatus Aegiribacteria sp.]